MKHQIRLGHPNALRPDPARAEYQQRAETDPAKRMQSANIPARFRDLGWNDYEKDSGVKPTNEYTETFLKDVLQQFAGEWQVGQREGLVLCGEPGRGKTMGVALLAKELCLDGVWVKFITNVDLGERRKEMFELSADRKHADPEDSSFWGVYTRRQYELSHIEQECDLLVLDDVGQEYRAASDWSAALLSQMLRRRGDLGKATIVTSNHTEDDWKTYNRSLYSYLWEVGEVLNIDFGRDHRLRPSRFRQGA